MTNTEVYRKAITHFGKNHQIAKALEELGELQVALARYLVGRGDPENIAEELADVEIMCEQLEMIFINRAKVLKIKQDKTDRLRRKISMENVNTLYDAR